MSDANIDIARAASRVTMTGYRVGRQFQAVHPAVQYQPRLGAGGAAFVPPGVSLRQQVTRAAVHRLAAMEREGDDYRPMARVVDEKAIVNPGSVGQPRDQDDRASYAILETGDDAPHRVNFYRLEYDITAVAEKIYAIDRLDDWLGDRLFQGR